MTRYNNKFIVKLFFVDVDCSMVLVPGILDDTAVRNIAVYIIIRFRTLFHIISCRALFCE